MWVCKLNDLGSPPACLAAGGRSASACLAAQTFVVPGSGPQPPLRQSQQFPCSSMAESSCNASVRLSVCPKSMSTFNGVLKRADLSVSSVHSARRVKASRSNAKNSEPDRMSLSFKPVTFDTLQDAKQQEPSSGILSIIDRCINAAWAPSTKASYEHALRLWISVAVVVLGALLLPRDSDEKFMAVFARMDGNC